MIGRKNPTRKPPPQTLVTLTAIILALALFESILTVWIESPWNLAIPEVLVLGLTVLSSLWFLSRPFQIQFSTVLIPLAAPIFIGLIQLTAHTTIYRWNTWNSILLWAVDLAACWLALQTGVHSKLRAAFLQTLLWFGFLFSALSVATFYSGTNNIFGFIPGIAGANYLGPFSNKDHYAAFVELILPLALYHALTRRNFYIGAVMSAMLYASVIAGASRAGSLLVTLEVLAIPIIIAARRRSPSSKSAHAGVRPSRGHIAALLALLALFTIAAGYTRLTERIQERDPYLGRYQILLSAREMFLAHPLTGCGLGNFEIAYPPFAHYDDGAVLTHTHNDWVEWTLDGGIPLFLSLLALAVLAAPALWRSVWGLGIVSVCLHCLIDYPLHRPAVALWLFVLLGLIISRQPASNYPDF